MGSRGGVARGCCGGVFSDLCHGERFGLLRARRENTLSGEAERWTGGAGVADGAGRRGPLVRRRDHHLNAGLRGGRGFQRGAGDGLQLDLGAGLVPPADGAGEVELHGADDGGRLFQRRGLDEHKGNTVAGMIGRCIGAGSAVDRAELGERGEGAGAELDAHVPLAERGHQVGGRFDTRRVPDDAMRGVKAGLRRAIAVHIHKSINTNRLPKRFARESARVSSGWAA